MKQLVHLLKTNSFARLALGASVGILLLIIIFSASSTPSPVSPTRVPSGSTRPELTSLEPKVREGAADYRENTSDVLPIYFKGFKTSVGIETDINIFVLKGDPKETVRFEIYGLSYLSPSADPAANPNVTAYKESFEHGLKLMRKEGLVPEQMIFLYSDIDYIRTAADSWVKQLNLLP